MTQQERASSVRVPPREPSRCFKPAAPFPQSMCGCALRGVVIAGEARQSYDLLGAGALSAQLSSTARITASRLRQSSQRRQRIEGHGCPRHGFPCRHGNRAPVAIALRRKPSRVPLPAFRGRVDLSSRNPQLPQRGCQNRPTRTRTWTLSCCARPSNHCWSQ